MEEALALENLSTAHLAWDKLKVLKVIDRARIEQKELLSKELQTLKHTKMTKADIVSDIAKKTGIDKTTVLSTVEAFMSSVKESLANEENVYLRGFGSFILKKRAQKTARNISKNTTLIIPEHNIPAFKPAKSFVAAVSGEVVNEE